MGYRDLDRRTFLKAPVILGAATACGTLGLLIGPKSAQAQSLAAAVEAAQDARHGIFGSIEVASKSFTALPQWARVLQEIRSDLVRFRGCASGTAACNSAAQQAWAEVIRLTQGLPKPEQLDKVNRFFNRWPYKLDHEIYGVSEYWASPSEFMRRSGDCEDYSIAKFFALRELGFDNEELRIVILLDRIRNIGHAVLAVYEKSDILVLDSLSDLIFSHAKYKHYIPQYSMNESTRWAHIPG